MKRWTMGSMVALAIAAVAATGCANNKKKQPDAASSRSTSQYPAMNQASLDVPTTPPAAPPASYTPPPQPVVYDPPAPIAPADQAISGDALVDASGSYAPPPPPAPARTSPRRASASASGTRYKVKKGESLWSIAEAKYGNGHKWKSIAAANPSIDPNHIQAGQTIVLP